MRPAVVAVTLLPLSLLLGASDPVAAPDPHAPARAVRIAVLDLGGSGIDPRVTAVVTESLLSELRKLTRVSVLSMGEVRSMLDFEAQKQLLGCDQTTCVQELADALGADVLISGGLARVGDQSVMTLKRVEPAKATVAKSFERRLTPAGGEEYLAVLGEAVEQLFPEVPLRPGAVRGVSPEIARRLNPPPLPRWSFVVAASLTGAVAIGAGVAGVLWSLNQGDYQAYAREGLTRTIDGASLHDKRSATEGANVALWSLTGVAAAATLVTGVMAPFVDWQGAADEVSP